MEKSYYLIDVNQLVSLLNVDKRLSRYFSKYKS